MTTVEFSNPQTHDFPEWVLVGEYYYYAKDIVSFGNELTVANLGGAYRVGIFPWHMDGMPLPWFCPERRAVLNFAELKIPRSLAKDRRKQQFTFSIDKNFREVIQACAKMKRPDQAGTWITPEFVEAYYDLHVAGMAHSVEAWDASGDLVGGLYGVDAGGVFCGESMFYIAPNASKLSLLFLIDHMRENGATWLDAQVMTPHMETLGAREIDRKDFLDRLKETQNLRLEIF
ncbi:MAG: leucyl/phenylalanyl-tRNA--protein transferase [Pyrinomonadaceae bacterium]